MDLLFQGLGIAGLLSITVGVLKKRKCRADEYFILGGALLLVYSIYRRDLVFAILQVVFMTSALYDFYKHRCKR